MWCSSIFGSWTSISQCSTSPVHIHNAICWNGFWQGYVSVGGNRSSHSCHVSKFKGNHIQLFHKLRLDRLPGTLQLVHEQRRNKPRSKCLGYWECEFKWSAEMLWHRRQVAFPIQEASCWIQIQELLDKVIFRPIVELCRIGRDSTFLHLCLHTLGSFGLEWIGIWKVQWIEGKDRARTEDNGQPKKSTRGIPCEIWLKSIELVWGQILIYLQWLNRNKNALELQFVSKRIQFAT